MVALFTASDRQRHRLMIEIERHERWLRDEADDRRAAAFHKAKILELQVELEKLQD